VSTSALVCRCVRLQGATGGGGFNDDTGVALARRGSDACLGEPFVAVQMTVEGAISDVAEQGAS